MKSRSFKKRAVLAATLVLFSGTFAHSADLTWDGEANDDLLNPTNWAGNGTPVNGDNLFFPASGSLVGVQSIHPTLSANYNVNKITFNAGAPTYNFDAGANILQVAPTGAGSSANSAMSFIVNNSASTQVINASTGAASTNLVFHIGVIDAAAGDIILNAGINVGNSQSSGSGNNFKGLNFGGSHDIYVNVDSSVNSLGNIAGGTWTSASNAAYNQTRQRIGMASGFSGTAFLGDIGTTFKGTFHIGSSANGAFRLTHANSLGQQTGGNYGVMIYGGNEEFGTLELSGSISTGRQVMLMDGRSGASADDPHMLNVSGDNTYTAFGGWDTGFHTGSTNGTAVGTAGNINFQSDSGTLTLAGGSMYNTSSTAKTLNFNGVGNGKVESQITTYLSNPSYPVVKKGSGTWTLANPSNDYTGATTIEAGVLSLGVTGNILGSPAIDVRSGATFDVAGIGAYNMVSGQTIKGAGTISGSINAAFGTIAPGDSGVGTLTISSGGNLTLNGGTTLHFQLSTSPLSGNDKIVVAGDLIANGASTINVSAIGGTLGSGSYRLIDYTGAATNIGLYSLTGTPASPRQTFALSSVANQLNLDVMGGAANLTWVGGVNSNAWDEGVTINWTGHSTDNRFFTGDSVTFSTSTNSPVDVVGILTPGSVTFSNSAGNNYTLQGSGQINAGGNFTVSGSGNVTLSHVGTSVSNNLVANGSGTLTIAAGDFNVGNDVQTSGTGSILVNNNNFTVAGDINTNANSSLTLANFGTTTIGGSIVNNGTITLEHLSDFVLPNSISGNGNLIKNSTNTATLSGDNFMYAGNISVNFGTLRSVSGSLNTLGSGVGQTTVADGATLDLTGVLNPNEIVNAGGSGFNGQGAIANSGGSVASVKSVVIHNTSSSLTINAGTGGTINIGGSAGAAFTGNAKDVDIVTTEGAIALGGNYSEVALYNIGDSGVANWNIRGGGALFLQGNSTLGSAPGTVTIFDNSELGFYDTTVVQSKPIVIDATGGGINNFRADNVLASPITMNGETDITNWSYNSDTPPVAYLTLSGKISGTGNITFHARSNAGARTSQTILTSNDNDYTGITTIGGGGGSSTINAAGDRISLWIGNGGTTGSLGTGDVIVNSGRSVNFNRNATYTQVNNFTLNGNGYINTVASNGNLTLSGVISGTGRIFNSDGHTILTNVNTYTGSTSVDSGLLEVSPTGSIDGSQVYNIEAAGALLTNHIIATDLNLQGTATIRANGGLAGASQVENLTIGATGKLNLKDNDLVVGTAADVNAVRDAIKLGLTGTAGITSDLPAFGTTTGFGYAMGNDAAISPLLGGFLTGQSYDADSVLVKYTFLGDADLDGDSDLNDLGLWAQSFTGDLGNPVSPATYWTSGDFDYDGDTDLNDLGFWAGTFTGDLGGGAGSLIVHAPNAPAGAVAALNSMGITVVPEPSTFVLAGVGLAGLAIAVKRKRKS